MNSFLSHSAFLVKNNKFWFFVKLTFIKLLMIILPNLIKIELLSAPRVSICCYRASNHFLGFQYDAMQHTRNLGVDESSNFNCIMYPCLAKMEKLLPLKHFTVLNLLLINIKPAKYKYLMENIKKTQEGILFHIIIKISCNFFSRLWWKFSYMLLRDRKFI